VANAAVSPDEVFGVMRPFAARLAEELLESILAEFAQ
jgi:hypothetical protein